MRLYEKPEKNSLKIKMFKFEQSSERKGNKKVIQIYCLEN